MHTYTHIEIYVHAYILKYMPISEDRLHLLLPSGLKGAARERARHRGLSVGEYVRRLIKADLEGLGGVLPVVDFPFGKHPIQTGRSDGSIEHDRPE